MPVHRKMLRARLAYDALPLCEIVFHDEHHRPHACQNRKGHTDLHSTGGVTRWPDDARNIVTELLEEVEGIEQERDALRVQHRPLATAMREIVALLGQWTDEDHAVLPITEIPGRVDSLVNRLRGHLHGLLEPARTLLEGDVVAEGDTAAEKKAVRAFRAAVQGADGVVIP